MTVTSCVMVTWIFTPPVNGQRIVRARTPKRSAAGTMSEWTSRYAGRPHVGSCGVCLCGV
eukprot:6883828-Heterocapsa_arctica.AAC.1